MSEPIDYDLTENALDYLILAGEQAKEGGARKLKHSVANLADGIELLLKAKLEMHDWKELFRDPSKADQTKYEEGDFRSVSFEETIERLRDHCSVEIDTAGRAVIESLRKLRNRIRHFGISVEQGLAVSLLVKTFAFAIDFTAEHIEKDHENLPEDDLARLRLLLTEFEAYVDERLSQLEPILIRHEPFVDCPACLQRAFMPDGSGDRSRCHFCGFSCEGERAASIWVDQFGPFQSPKERSISPLIESCPECGSDSFVNVSRITDLDDIGYLCFSCGEWGEYRRCSSCGQAFKGEESICDDCFYDKAN